MSFISSTMTWRALFLTIVLYGVAGAPSSALDSVFDLLSPFKQAVSYQGITPEEEAGTNLTLWRIRPKMPLISKSIRQYDRLRDEIADGFSIYLVGKQMSGSSGTLLTVMSDNTVFLSITSLSHTQQLKIRYVDNKGASQLAHLQSPFGASNELIHILLVLETNQVRMFVNCEAEQSVILETEADLQLAESSVIHLFQTGKARNKFNGWIHTFEIHSSVLRSPLWSCEGEGGGTAARDEGVQHDDPQFTPDLYHYSQTTRGGGSRSTSFVSSTSSSSRRVSHISSGGTRSITPGTASQTASQLSSEECVTSISLLQSSVSELTRMLDAVKEENSALRGQLALLATCECKVQACIYDEQVYENDQRWYADPCTECQCLEGSTLCTMLSIPECDDPCALSPCLNGGTCIGNPGYQNFTCLCPPSCAGNRCQYEINVCALGSEYGECSERLLRYYYDPFQQRCVDFVYSGCGGNGNNFLSYQACQEQCLVGACCYRTFNRLTQGDDFAAFTRLTPGHRCQELSLAECRLLGTINPTSDQRNEVTAFHPGMACEEVNCGPTDSCTVDGIDYVEGAVFRRGCQNCRCVNGGRVECSCRNLSVRKEIRDMTRSEIERFQAAVRILRGTGPGNAWEALRDLYITHVMEAHSLPFFLLWHRMYLTEVEKKLQEIDCSITIPYFDFTTDVYDLPSSVVWQPNYFGGNGEGEQNCVPDHPFRNDTSWVPCLTRSFQSNHRLPTKLDVALAMASDNFATFSECLQMILGHVYSFVGGHIATSAAPYDPLFLPIQAYADMLFWQWQKKNGNENTFPLFLLNVPMVPFNTRPRDALQLESRVCVSYSLPSLGAPCNHTDVVFNNFGFDAEGYDRNGFNRQGFDRFGYNANGFDRYGQRDTRDIYIYNLFSFEGYNRAGYDRRGYNRYGYNVEGYNRDGYDIYGFDSQGYNRYGFDQDGFDFRGYSVLGYDRSNRYDRSEYFDSSGYNFQCVDRQQLDRQGYDRFGYNLQQVSSNYCMYGFNGPHALWISYQVDQVLYYQSKEFLMAYTRTCAVPTREPILWYEQTWTARSKPLMRLQVTASNFPTSTFSQRFCIDVEPLISRCPCTREVVICEGNPCKRSCGSYPDAVCYIRICDGCFAEWYLNGEPVNCDVSVTDCTDGFNRYREGAIWRPDPCTTCRCSEGVVDCEVVRCPRASCSHAARGDGDCCPTCDGCQYGEFFYANGQTFNAANEPCSECTCINGNVECHTVTCPAVTCDYPWTYGDRCCPSCDGCVYDGRVLRNGQAFSYDTCTMCRCENGDVTCDQIECGVLSCANQISPEGSCCPRCRDGCEYEGMSFNNGDFFTPMSNPCLQCSCRDSIVRCHPLPCEAPSCNNPIYLLGACCPICTNKCVHDGRQYDSGDVWLTSDQCEECFCRGSEVSCRRSRQCPTTCEHGLIEEGQCCSSCTDCLYNGQAWSNFAEFPTEDGCDYCSCYYGTVTCRRKPCDTPTCANPVLLPGECCPSCKGCEDSLGNEYSHGERWIPRSGGRCQECVCQESQIICGRVECRNECTHPKIVPGACCPECDGCSFQGREYENNAPVYTRDSCETCVCRDGSVLCAEVECPTPPCRNPIVRPGQCCPECPSSTCDYEGQTYLDGQEFVPESDPCLRCTCRSGRSDCESIEYTCGVQCTHPVRAPNECCSTCRDCNYDGRTVPNGANFRNPNDDCQICSCSFGSIFCDNQECPAVTCERPIRRPGECCPECPKCVYEGREYENNAPVYSRDPCETCVCRDSRVECALVDCPPINCREPLIRPGQCCPECPDTTCEYEGRTYRDNEEFQSPSDPCLNCLCRDGRVGCLSEEPLCVTRCTHPVQIPGQCCPSCNDCMYSRSRIPNGSNFRDPEDDCQICSCQFGSVVCQLECPEIRCSNPVDIRGECCPQCLQCIYEGREYENGAAVYSRDPCETCVCREGEVACARAECRPPRCSNPVNVPGECCPQCLQCVYEGRQYENGAAVYSRDPCETCVCLEGEVNCVTAECPPPRCSNAVNVPGECCPQCLQCVYEGRQYENGAAVYSRDPCETCVCREGEVACTRAECPSPRCSNPVTLPGQCCPECPSDCEYEGRIYRDEMEFQSETDPCLRCICRAGRVDCQSIENRCITRCSHPVRSPDECCPVCLDCEYDRRTVRNGARFQNPDDECQICTCEFGTVDCEAEECPEVACRNPRRVSGECCPRCSVCVDNGQEYAEGESWLSSQQSCTTCRCIDGRTVCAGISCPTDLPCTHPARNTDGCCQECDNCYYDRRFFQNGQRSMDPLDHCRVCECRDGNMLCNPRECPRISCSEQYTPDGECCPRCAKCELEGQEYRDGETFPSPNDPCMECECYNGGIGCGPIRDCQPVTCTHPRKVDCCLECSGCEYNGIELSNGEELVSDEDCTICICVDGAVSCSENPDCDNPSSDDGSCQMNGQEYEDGQQFTDPSNPCVTCVCTQGMVQCRPVPCPTVDCAFPKSDGCCLVCDEGCRYLNETYEENEEFKKPDDPCQTCVCRRGNLDCHFEACSEIAEECDAVISRVGECCSVCAEQLTSKCVEGGVVYSNGEIIKNFTSCQQCQCFGSIRCEEIQCEPVSCDYPRTLHCCPSCTGCYYEGETWVSGAYFADPQDNCANCQCNNGNVFCQKVPCPVLGCPHQTQLVNTCCPVCIDVDCEYFGTTYEHGSIFPHAEDACQECSCDDGNVFCRRNPCPRPQCPYPIRGECCETCDGCYFTGVEYSNGEIFEDPTTPCQDCECQSGYISCTERPCEEPPCGYPVKPSGECCASCEGCFFGGRSYRNGDTFGNPDNACQMCDCTYGNVTCEKARCPFAACEYPTNDECGCPICNGCSYRGVEYRDGMSFPDPQDSCRECSCLKGYISCTNVQCPRPRCFHPALLPGQCCETCDSCLYEGGTYQNGQEFPDSVDSCRICTCVDGNVNCGTKLCGRVACLHPMMDECNCPVCDGCMYEDVMVMSGDIFPDPNDDCKDCICELGSARCYERQCPAANCSSPTEVPGECCPVCLEAECLEEPDPCGDCVCEDGNWVCETRPCPDVSCPHAGQGMCCLECDGCTFGGKPWANGDSFQDPADGCGICTCTNGFVVCEDPVCEPVDCPNPTVPAGRCCPVCVGQCTVDGVKYNNNEEFTPRTDPCQHCNCRNGQVFCSAVECSRLCGHPRPEPGQCCPVCDGCSFEDVDYNNGVQFIPPSNPCHSCTCFNGNVECEVIECPALECPTPVEVPGQCCAVCQECTYFGRTYIDGSTWPSREEPCTECRCVGTRVRCQPLTCANAECTHPVSGACCPLCDACLFEENIYNNGQTFRPDNCRQCNCLNGNVICTSEECPVLTCQNTVRDPGQCCDRCQGCLYEGFEYGSGETWVSPLNHCLTCQCQDGVTMCTEIRCLTPDFCTNPVNVPGHCCPICPGCSYNGVTYQNGQSFNPYSDPCESCLCERGSLTCVRQSCPVLNECPPEGIQPPAIGECCGTCTSVQEQRVCDEVSLGRTYKPYSDPCFTCTCTNSSTWECMQDMCPMLMCPRSERFKQKDECCPKCQRCVDEDTGSSYFTGQTWRKGSDSCILCSCDYGAISCQVEKCPEIQCEEGLEPVKPDGLCCPECTDIQVPCYYQGVQHESGDRWARDECTTCECAEGEVRCETRRCQAVFCEEDEVPTLNPGSCCPVCMPRPATCIAFGDPHYRTFDGKLIHYQGTCRYVMSMDCTNQDFIVEVKNSNRGVGGGVSWTEEVTVIVDGTQVDLGQSGIVKVDREIIIPPFLKGSVVNIEKRGDGYYVNTNVGLTVLWDGSSYVEVSIPGSYARRTCGLCGNFNGYAQDDLRTRSNEIVNSVAMFGNSWKVPGFDSQDCDADDTDPCDSAGYYVRRVANIKCASIQSARFTRCHSAVSPEPYYAACVYDLCACTNSDTCLCDAVGAYAAECRQAGIFIDWRDASLCAIDCPEDRGLMFDECGPACPRTCINKDIPLDLINEQCLRPCVPGCQCPADKVLHSGACIPAENCPVDFKVNATIVTDGRDRI